MPPKKKAKLTTWRARQLNKERWNSIKENETADEKAERRAAAADRQRGWRHGQNNPSPAHSSQGNQRARMHNEYDITADVIPGPSSSCNSAPREVPQDETELPDTYDKSTELSSNTLSPRTQRGLPQQSTTVGDHFTTFAKGPTAANERRTAISAANSAPARHGNSDESQPGPSSACTTTLHRVHASENIDAELLPRTSWAAASLSEIAIPKCATQDNEPRPVHIKDTSGSTAEIHQIANTDTIASRLRSRKAQNTNSGYRAQSSSSSRSCATRQMYKTEPSTDEIVQNPSSALIEEPRPGPSSDCIAERVRSRAQQRISSLPQVFSDRAHYRIAYRDLGDEEIQENYLGAMDEKCTHCNALHFRHERTKDTKTFPNCCHGGSVKIAAPRVPKALRELVDGTSPHSSHFITNIRSYNSSFAFASLQTNVQRFQGATPSFFKIHGQLYHRVGSLHAENTEASSYSQLYILDPTTALELRTARNQRCHRTILDQLDTMLRECNPYAHAFKMMKEVEEEMSQREVMELRMFLTCTRGHDSRRFNPQRSNEVAMVFTSPNGQPPSQYDLCIRPRNQPLKTISSLNSNSHPMAFPLLYPYGDRGWGPDLKQKNGTSCLQYHSYQLAYRKDSFLHMCGRLFEQDIVTSAADIIGQRLKHHADHQVKIRAESYTGLMDHLTNVKEKRDDITKAGVPVILPSTHIGGDRWKAETYQDAMAIVRKCGRPHLFLTFTANPHWREITENLIGGQSPWQRPDLVARVFHLKLKELLCDIWTRKIFGKVQAYVYSIEFQKRGMPHAHMLIILDSSDAPITEEQIDRAISAEIPDEKLYPRLFKTVTRHVIHGPCGVINPACPCMDQNKCTKKFPKEFRSRTDPNSNGYPLYRRRAGYVVKIKRQKREVELDNSWVVPHNKFLMYKYNAHINLEICSSIKSVKYLYKYIFKGFDMACVVIEDGVATYNEIKHHEIHRYLGSPEGMWRILEYELSKKSHTVERLAIHLKDMQNIFFREGDEALAIARSKKTKLTAWFKLNKDQPEARQYYYSDIPDHYIFEPTKDKKDNEWRPRADRACRVASRIYFASPSNVELYHLRLLLLHVKGPQNWDDLYTVDGIKYDTFKEACRQRGLLHDDTGNKETLEEAATFKSSRMLRQTFAVICAFCEPENELQLWEQFKNTMHEDFQGVTEQDAERLALADIRRILAQHSYDFTQSNLPDPGNVEHLLQPRSPYNREEEMQEALKLMSTFTSEQQSLFDAVIKAVENPQEPERCFFLDGFGGSGKTYTYSAILSYLRGKGYNVIAVAWTGIAARLLKGGRTVHGQFKLPLQLNEDSRCNISAQHKTSRYIRTCKIVVWDEISMASRFALEAIERYFQDLAPTTPNQKPLPFNGTVFLTGGDFRQTLPVVKKGGKEEILETSVKFSPLWGHFKTYKFTQNKRTRPRQQEFSDYILKLGEGRLHSELGEDIIKIEPEFITQNNIIEDIFGTEIDIEDVDSLANRAILCPKNEEALAMNEKVLELIKHGEIKTYYSYDEVKQDDPNDCTAQEASEIPCEFLHSLTPTGFPPHQLNVKVGAIVILLRNMDISMGLCNGTRLIVRSLGNHIIEGEVVSGSNKGLRYWIPRIVLQTDATELPFILRRRQFPIRLSFIMTINKSQGQEFNKVGIYLPAPVFSHGQLYTAFSRAKAAADVKIQISETDEQGPLKKKCKDIFTKNIVYREIFELLK